MSYDFWLLYPSGCLLLIGLLMVSSASMVISDRQFHHPWHFSVHQAVSATLGVVVALVVAHWKMRFWQRIGPYLLLLSMILLAALFIPALGFSANGSTRWLAVGPIHLQVSECVKFSNIMYLAGYLVRHEQQVRQQMMGFIKPLVLMIIIALLLLAEPDFGATAVLLWVAFGMMFLAGVQLWPFILLLLVAAGMLAVLAISSPYRLARLTSFLHPWHTAFGGGYQLVQSLIAFGRGGVTGVGLGNSIQKLFYLPEAHTDFLFAVLAEELGLLGELFVVLCFVVLVGRALWIAKVAYRQEQHFIAYVGYGLGLWLALQAMINMGVNLGVLPTKGLTLPLISYGGSSLLINCCVVGVLLRISHEIRSTASTMLSDRRNVVCV